MNSSKELSFNNVVRDGSSGSDKSNDSEQVNGGLSKDECEYLKSLSEDKKRENELINLVNLLKQRNEELEHQMKKSEMISKNKYEMMVSSYEINIEILKDDLKARIRKELDLVDEVNRLEYVIANKASKNEEMKLQDLEKKFGELRIDRGMGSQVQLKESLEVKSVERKEENFLEEDLNNTVIKGNALNDNGKKGIFDNISESGVSAKSNSKGKTGRTIRDSEVRRLKESLKTHGPIKFFKDLEFTFQQHEVESLVNRIRVVKMRILENFEFANSIEEHMSWEQVVKIINVNDDSATRQKHYNNLLMEAAKNISDTGSGLANYITVFEKNYRSLYNGMDAFSLIENFLFFLPIEAKEKVRTKAKEGALESTNLSNWITLAKELANDLERKNHEENTRKKNLRKKFQKKDSRRSGFL